MASDAVMSKRSTSEAESFEAGGTEIHDKEKIGHPSIFDKRHIVKVEKILDENQQITRDDLHILVPGVS